jgi:hypothetical protein
MTYKFKMMKVIAVTMFAAVLLLGYLSQGMASGHDQEKEVDASKMEQSGTLTFHGESMNLIAGGTWGEGVLSYKGKQYKFKAKSIGAGYSVGYKEVDSKAAVYNLKNVNDFAGTYWGVKAGGTLFVGAEVANVTNEKDVLLNISGTSEGAAVDIAAGLKRIVIEMAN